MTILLLNEYFLNNFVSDNKIECMNEALEITPVIAHTVSLTRSAFQTSEEIISINAFEQYL